MKSPDKAWIEITENENQKASPEPTLFLNKIAEACIKFYAVYSFSEQQ